MEVGAHFSGTSRGCGEFRKYFHVQITVSLTNLGDKRQHFESYDSTLREYDHYLLRHSQRACWTDGG